VKVGSAYGSELEPDQPVVTAIMAMATVLVWKAIPQLPIADSSEPASVGAALRGYLALLRRRAVVAASVAFLLIFLGISLYMMYLPAWRSLAS